ncbi:MAG: hypothetical protein R3321_03000 [Nitrososphaeraceae archaeon]|nr:hypothetical protein [Nitrososphaeraceae archaeon]
MNILTRFLCVLIVVFLIWNVIGIYTYDYFYGLEQERCYKILNLKHDVGTDQVSKCLSYQVSEFWHYTLYYYLNINIIFVLICLFIALISALIFALIQILFL